MDVAIVGSGRVGTALGVLLRRAGHRIVAAAGGAASSKRVAEHLSDAFFVELDRAGERTRHADLVLICVPDDAVEAVCRALAADGGFGPGQLVAHVSGALDLSVLDAARDAGGRVLSLHPLQSFPTVEAGVARLPGSGIAVTAREEETAAAGEGLARDMGGVPFGVRQEVKHLYHAAAVFASNYLVTVEATAERLFRLAGIDDPAPLFAPLARANLLATFTDGPGRALTGPAVRGDTGTISRNAAALRAHAPSALPAYLDLAALAADLAVDSGGADASVRDRVREELDRWR